MGKWYNVYNEYMTLGLCTEQGKGIGKQMKKKITLQNIYIAFLCIHTVLLIIGGLTIKEDKFNSGESRQYIEIVPDGHEIWDDGTQQYTFACGSNSMDYYLLFYTNHQEVHVYADNELIYKRGRADTIFGHTSGAVWNMMNFPGNTKEIVITIKAIYSSGEDNLHTFYKGSGVGILRQLVQDSVFAMGVSLLLVIIGICMAIYWLFLCRKTRVAMELLYIGFSAILIGTWSFTEEKPVMLLFDNRVYASYITYVLLMLIGVTFMLFLKHYIVKEGRYLHKFLAAFAIGGMSLMMILQCLDIADFKETVWIVHIVLVCDLLYFLLGILNKLKDRRHKKQVGLNMAGLIVLAAAVGLELYAYYARLSNMQIFGMFGLLAYIIILGMEAASEASEKIAEMRKAEIYKELAEKDMLTKCYNRNAYSEDIQKKFHGDNIFVVMFDLNNLKTCNDTLGYMEGDRYLTDSADVIKKIFQDYGKVYRIGGDEFCIIMEDTSEDEICALIRKLMQEEEAYNGQSQRIHMQIASGYARYDAEKDADLDKTRSRADELMYENKRQLKGGSLDR